MPSDRALLAISKKLADKTFELAIVLGVPIPQVDSFVYKRHGPVMALHYWSSGMVKDQPTTWRFLLECINEVAGARIAEEIEAEVQRDPSWSTVKV